MKEYEKKYKSNLVHKAIALICLPICTGILLGISALPESFYYLSFVAFVPLLFAADNALPYKSPFLVFTLQVLIALVVFYMFGYYWVIETANLGFLIAFIVLLPYALIIACYILFKKKSSHFSALYFIAAWLTMELMQANLQLGSPFYNLGNNLGANVKIIQWYEFTGAAGGTLWILLVNVLLYSLIKNIRVNQKKNLQKGAILVAVLFTPIIISYFIYSNYVEKGFSKEVIVVHPSTDNRDVKYRLNIYELMDIYLDIILPEITTQTEYVVLPETAITNAGWVKDFNRNMVFNHFNERTDSFPDLKLITGAITYEKIPNVETIKHYKKIPGIRYSEKYRIWYYTYNAALQIDKKQPPQIRAKDKLVPYQEYAPYPTILPRIAPVGIDFQFSKREDNSSVFKVANSLKTAAFVCYEVIYSKLFYKAAKNGAQAFFVLLNEGWYESNRVPKQFLKHSLIKAVENRRSIAHSSNMGISAIINQRGDVIDKTESKEARVLKSEIKMNRKVTLVVMIGNYIEILASVVAVCLFLFQIFIKKRD